MSPVRLQGHTSQTTFGSPGRLAGIVTGEWEEKSPWAPLAERRAGLKGDAVTSFGAMGTMNVIDTTSILAADFLEMIGKSYAYIGCNNFSGAVPFGEALIAINPICGEIVGRTFPNIEDVQEVLWKHASVDANHLTKEHRDQIEGQGRIRADGRLYATPEPKDVLVFVAGGLGGCTPPVCILSARRSRRPRLSQRRSPRLSDGANPPALISNSSAAHETGA